MQKRNSIIFYFVFSICIIALKFAFVFTRHSERSFTTFDSQSYLDLARSFPESFFDSSEQYLRELSLLRTPGYPIFLWVLDENPMMVIFVQSLIQIAMGYIGVLIYREASQRVNIKFERIVFVAVNLETSLTVHSLYLLSDLLFAFAISLFMLFLIKYMKNQRNTNATFLIAVLVMIVAVAIRPVGIVLCVYLPMLALATRELRKTALILTSLVVWLGIWSGYNFLRAEVFTYSIIQNHNLLMYEGAGAKAISNKIKLKDSQVEELERREQKLGTEATLSEINSYSFDRGVDLIAENFSSFIKMHFLGTLKIIYGPNQGEAIRFLTEGTRVSADSDSEKFLVAIMFLFTFVIGTMSIIALLYFCFKQGVGNWISQLVLIFILFSSGAQAYGRFRAPIAVFMVVLSVNLLEHLLERKVYFKSMKKDESISDENENRRI